MDIFVSTPDCGPVARHPFEFTSRCASVPVMYELGSEFSIEVAIRRDGATLATLDISLDGEEWVTLKTTTSGTETQKLRTRTVETSEYSVTVDVKVRTDDEHVEASMLLRTVHIMERTPPSEAAEAADAADAAAEIPIKRLRISDDDVVDSDRRERRIGRLPIHQHHRNPAIAQLRNPRHVLTNGGHEHSGHTLLLEQF